MAYRETNKDKLKAYYGAVIKCDCGIDYTRHHKLRHERTKRHLEFFTNPDDETVEQEADRIERKKDAIKAYNKEYYQKKKLTSLTNGT